MFINTFFFCLISVVSFRGPGGDYGIQIGVTALLDRGKAVRTDGLQVNLCRTYNYVPPVVSFVTDSANFRITNLPSGVFDLIIRKEGFLPKKISCIKLDTLTSSFSDTVTIFGEQRKVAGITVCFKSSASVAEKKNIVARSGIVFKRTSVVMDTLLYAPNVEQSVPEAIKLFIESPLTRYVDPVYPLILKQ